MERSTILPPSYLSVAEYQLSMSQKHECSHEHVSCSYLEATCNALQNGCIRSARSDTYHQRSTSDPLIGSRAGMWSRGKGALTTATGSFALGFVPVGTMTLIDKPWNIVSGQMDRWTDNAICGAHNLPQQARRPGIYD